MLVNHEQFGGYDVFVRDTETRATTLVSRGRADGATEDERSNAGEPSISADGRYVAFRQDSEVLVRDMVTRELTIVSRRSASDGDQPGDDRSGSPSISGDGRYVAFVSAARNLSDADRDRPADVFVRDRETGSTKLVSRRTEADGGEAANGISVAPSISADGRLVAFESRAANLSDEDSDRTDDVFVRDLEANTTALVSRRSRADGGQGAQGDSGSPSISGDGRRIAFTSNADDLPGAAARCDESGWCRSVYVRNMRAQTTALVSRRRAAVGNQPADGDSRYPSISADGRYVSFSSDATNLTSADDDEVFDDQDVAHSLDDVFVRDLEARTTTLVSRRRASAGRQAGNRSSEASSVSAGGRFVAFDSNASNLSGLDNNEDVYPGSPSDVFRRDVLGP